MPCRCIDCIPMRCSHCHLSADWQCSGCHYTRYCGETCQKKAWPDHKKMCFAFSGRATGDELLAITRKERRILVYQRFWSANARTIEMQFDAFGDLVEESLPALAYGLKAFFKGDHDAEIRTFLNFIFRAAFYIVFNGGRYFILSTCSCSMCASGKEYNVIMPMIKHDALAIFFRWSGS